MRFYAANQRGRAFDTEDIENSLENGSLFAMAEKGAGGKSTPGRMERKARASLWAVKGAWALL